MSNAVSSSSPSPSDADVLRAVPPVKRVRELRVGIFVILGLAGFFVVLFTMTSPGSFRGRYTVLTVVDDAQGMRRGDAVQMRGVNVGRVRGFDLGRETGVQLSLEIEGDWRIPVGSRTEVISQGFLGGKVVSIITGPGPGFLEPGVLLPGESVGGVLEVASGMADVAADVLVRAQAVLSDSTIAGTGAAILALRDLLNEAQDMTDGWAAEARAVLEDLKQSAANVEGITGAEEWLNTLASAESTLATLERTSVTLEQSSASLNSILGRIERGEGTLGKLLADDSLYDSTDAALASLRELLEDLRENPDRYINVTLKIF